MNTKREKPYGRRLKGLEALIGEPTNTETNTETASCGQFVNIEQIKLPSKQPRRYFEPQKLDQLVESIKRHGILEPLLVRVLSDGQFELVAGERRYRAAKLAELSEVPVIVRSLTEQEAWQLSLIENLQREDLNPVEETEGILELLSLELEEPVSEVVSVLYRMHNISTGKITNNVIGNSHREIIQNVFSALGLMEWESFTANRLPLLRLPGDILEALRQGKIEYTKAKAIAKLKDEAERLAMLTEAISENLSLSEIRERMKIKTATEAKKLEDVKELENQIESTYKRIKKLKLWVNPQKREKLEFLFAQIEALIDQE